MKILLITLSALFALSSFAKEKTKHREHGAHQHGAGTLGIAFDGLKAKLDFKIPSDSVVGFEYTPKTEKDKSTKKTQLDKLENRISEMVVFDSSLNCKITTDKIEVIKDEEESKETHSEHSDTFAKFDISCEKSPAGTKIIFNFQKVFPKIKDLDVQIIVGDIQKSVEAKKDGTTVELK